MDAFHNLLNPPVLFFFLGCVIALLRSDLTISASMASFFSLYLLLSQGFKGGVALSQSTVGWPLIIAVGCGLLMAVVIFSFMMSFPLRRAGTAPDTAAGKAE